MTTKPQRVHPDSWANRIAALNVGESVTLSAKLGLAGANPQIFKEQRTKVKNALGKYTDLAEKRSGNTYTVDTGQFITTSGDVMLCAVATRTS